MPLFEFSSQNSSRVPCHTKQHGSGFGHLSIDGFMVDTLNPITSFIESHKFGRLWRRHGMHTGQGSSQGARKAVRTDARPAMVSGTLESSRLSSGSWCDLSACHDFVSECWVGSILIESIWKGIEPVAWNAVTP